MQDSDTEERVIINANYVLFIGALTLFSVVNFILLLLPLSPEAQEVIRIVDGVISVILLLDFFYWLKVAPDWRRYLSRGNGWMVFLGSLPIPALRVFRLIQLLITARRFRRGEVETATKIVLGQRARSTLFVLLLFAIIFFEVAGVTIIAAERGAPDANITTAADALWWAYVTVTTVGYGDRFPVTAEGRILAAVLMTVGIALFSVLTGFTADWFRSSRRLGKNGSGDVAETPLAQLVAIQQLLDEEERAHRERISDLRRRIAELERVLS